MVDAGLFALEMLRARKGPRSRILLYIGQPFESGSTKKLAALESEAERDNVQIYALKLPIYGASFVSDTFRLQGLGSQAYRGGYQASVELTRALPTLQHAAQASAGTDPYSLLTSLTGGFAMHFRKQRELEDAILLMGEVFAAGICSASVPMRMTPILIKSGSKSLGQAQRYTHLPNTA